MNPEKMELLLEAERRGILDSDKKALLDEARRRGMVQRPATSTGGGIPITEDGSMYYGSTPEEAASRFGAFFKGIPRGFGKMVGGISQMGFQGGPGFVGLQIGNPALADAMTRADLAEVGGGVVDDLTGGLTELTDAQKNDLFSRIANRAGEEVGGSLIPSAALMRRAGQVAKTGQELSRLEKFFVEPFVRNPKTALATETTLAAGGGTGAGLLNEAIGDRTPYSDLLGNVLGSGATGTALSIARGGLNLLGDVGSVYSGIASPTGGQRVVEREVSDVLRSARRQDPLVAQAEMERNLPAAREYGLQLTAGQAMGDPGILELEATRRSMPGTGAARFAARDRENVEAASEALMREAPAAETDAATRAALRAEQLRVQQRAEGSLEPRRRELSAAERMTEPGQSVSEAGRTIRQQAERALEVAEDIRDAEALPILQRAKESGAVVDASPVVRRIDEIISGEKDPTVIGAMGRVRGLLYGADGELDTTVDGLYKARKVITQRMLKGQTDQPADRYAQSQLLEIVSEIDSAISRAFSEWGEYLSKYREGAQRVSALRDSPVGAVASRSISGQPDIPDAEVVAQFFRPGAKGKDAIEQFEIALGGSKPARQALRDYALAEARKAAETGPRGLESWLRRHRDALSVYPDIADDLGTLRKAQESLRIAKKRADFLSAGATDPRKSVMARYLSRDDARMAMNDILGSRNPVREMRQLVRKLRGDKDALEGARRAAFDLMMEGTPASGKGVISREGGQPVIQAKALADFLRKNEQALRQLYPDNPEHIDRLKKISEALQATRTSGRGSRISTGPKGGQRSMIDVIVSSRLYSLGRGFISLPYLALERGSALVRTGYVKLKSEQVQELLDRALLDPELAKTLMMRADERNARIIGRRLRLHLLDDLGYTEDDLEITDSPEDTENEDETR